MNPYPILISALSLSCFLSYLVIEDGNKAKCLICLESITAKIYNLQRHADTKHKEQFKKHPSKDDRVNWFNMLRIKIDEMKRGLKKHLGRSEIITKAALKIAHIILTKQKPFSDGEMVKECIATAMSDLLDYHQDKNKILNEIQQMQLSRRTIVRRAEILSKEIQRMTLKRLDNSFAISICLDESTDRNDVSQLVIFAKIVNESCSPISQPLGLIPLLTTTTSSVILISFLS